jgi:hypothetical protein
MDKWELDTRVPIADAPFMDFSSMFSLRSLRLCGENGFRKELGVNRKTG